METENGARNEKEQLTSDVELNGVDAGGRAEGVTVDENIENVNTLSRAKNEEVSALAQSDPMEKNERSEASDERLESALAR